jgi:hypothetical protein
MQELISNYLFQYKKCGIPHVGSLELVASSAVAVFGEQKIDAPQHTIQFSEKIINTNNLAAYIAVNKKIPATDAAKALDSYGESIKALKHNEAFALQNVGKFFRNASGDIAFEQIALPASFSPAVHAERVVHPNEAHVMLVGDTETNTAAMSEYLADEAPVNKARWWVWGIALFVLSLISMIFYFSGETKNSFFGSASKTEVLPADSTYRMLP